MKPDLQGLEITKGELKHLTGVGVGDVLRPPTLTKFATEIFQTILILILIYLSGLLLSYIFPEQLFWIVLIHLSVAVALILDDFRKINITMRSKTLISLFEDVERYNDIIKAIDINDEIEAAGNTQVKLKDREKVIEALKLTRSDLIRALKTERILRKNKDFIARNPELFVNNLAALTTLQVSDRASEHGRLLNEALQIAISTQEEMKKLQDRYFN